MKKTLKKMHSKTDDLLKRLGASLKDSPLKAHARAQATTITLEAPTAERATEMSANVGVGQGSEIHPNVGAHTADVGAIVADKANGSSTNPILQTTQNAQTSMGQGLTGAPVFEAREKLAKGDVHVRKGQALPVEAASLGESHKSAATQKLTATSSKSVVWSNEGSAEDAAPTRERSITESVAQSLAQKKRPGENPVRSYVNETQGGATTPVQMAEAINEMMIKTAAPLTTTQVEALAKAPAAVKEQVRLEEGLMEVDSLKNALQAVDAPLSERQALQINELKMMREAIEEIKRLQRSKATPKETAAAAPAWTGYPAGSQRPSASGWKTSTIGLYPEDYEKAYALMNYLRAQTGQNVNLSRVIKIALRAIEVGPQVLQINEEIRAKDGRLMSRRA